MARIVMRIVCAAVIAWSLTVGDATAQSTKAVPKKSTLPAAAGAQQLAPEQIRDILWWRAFQNRRSGPVQTGVPQFVPFGHPWSFGMPMQPSTGTRQNKSSLEERAAARAAREEEKRVAREQAKAKREAAAKARAEAKANAQPKDEQAPAEP